jgi:hypothetical protein
MSAAFLGAEPKQIDSDLNVTVITGSPDSEILDRILQVCPVTILNKPLKIEPILSDG